MKSLLAVGLLFLASACSAVPTGLKSTGFGAPSNNATILKDQHSVVAAMCRVFCPKFSAAGVAGIVGNAAQESSLDPTIKQYGGGPGRGLFQMSVGALWAVNKDYCAKKGCNVMTAAGQSEFVLATIEDPTWADKAYGWGTAKELQSELQTHSVSSAAVSFMAKWERCGDCDSGNRINYANQWHSYVKQQCGGAPPPPPPPPPAPAGGCHQVWPDLCPGNDNCMCSTRAGCVSGLNASHFTTAANDCAGKCYEVIRDQCAGNNLCVKLGNLC